MSAVAFLADPRSWSKKLLCKYGFQFAAMGYNDKWTLWYFAERVPKGGNVVEIGSFRGGSAALFATVRPDVTIHCVDPWIASAESYIYNGDIFAEFQENTKQFDNIVPHRGLSEDIAKEFDEPIDLLFIDGDHSFMGAYIDLLSWNKKCKPQSYTIMHDAEREGVRRAIIQYFGSLDLGHFYSRKMYVVETDERLQRNED